MITLVEFLVLLFKLCTEGCWPSSNPSTPLREDEVAGAKKYLNGSPKRPFDLVKEDRSAMLSSIFCSHLGGFAHTFFSALLNTCANAIFFPGSFSHYPLLATSQSRCSM